MKAKTIMYSRLINKGNYENEKIEICLEVEDGEKAHDVLKAAKEFVDTKCEVGRHSIMELEDAERIVASPKSYTGYQVEAAQKLLDKINYFEDLPF